MDQRGVAILLCGGWDLEACNSRQKVSKSYAGPLTYAISLKILGTVERWT